MNAKPRMVSIEAIIVDATVQSRTAIDEATVDAYAEAMQNGAKFPAVVVFGMGKVADGFILADGFHRVAGAGRAGLSQILADVHGIGTLEGDLPAIARQHARLHAASANMTHGLRRTNADKRRAVAMVLDNPDARRWGDRRIAKHCGVHHELVGVVRASLADSASDDGVREVVTKHGTTTMMDTSKIGTKSAAHDAGRAVGLSDAEVDTCLALADMPEPVFEDALSKCIADDGEARSEQLLAIAAQCRRRVTLRIGADALDSAQRNASNLIEAWPAYHVTKFFGELGFMLNQRGMITNLLPAWIEQLQRSQEPPTP